MDHTEMKNALKEMKDQLLCEIKQQVAITIKEETVKFISNLKVDVIKELKPTIADIAKTEIKKVLESSSPSMDTADVNSVLLLSAKVEVQQEDIEKQEQELAAVKASQDFISQLYEDQKTELSNLQSTSKTLESLEKAVENLNNKIQEYSIKIDEMDQLSRRETLELHGVPKVQNENINDTIITLMKLININLKKEEISNAYRLPQTKNSTFHPPIIVKFSSRAMRDEIYAKRTGLKKYKDNQFPIKGMVDLFINENLTKQRRAILSLARKTRQEKNYQYVWTANGQIFVRKHSNAQKYCIKSEEDLKKLN